MKNKITLIVLYALLPAFIFADNYKIPGQVKFDNVILLISDGMTTSGRTLARWYKNGFMAIDGMYRSDIMTYSEDSIITDSAAAATAFGTGCKAISGQLGILPQKSDNVPLFPGVETEKRCIGEPGKPVATVLEAAKLKGKAVGLVVTCEVQEATPAGFFAHIGDRDKLAEIARQQVYQDLDVVFGGGKKYLLPQSGGGVREDGDDLTAVLKERGYLLIDSLEELKDKEAKKVWGLFAPEDLAFEMDREELNQQQPSLKDMTEAALHILSANNNGFFLMVEGSKIDWAAHDNDPVGVISDILSFDAAVKSALEFAAQDGHTLVIVVSDHACGGMSIGANDGGRVPYHIPYSEIFNPLKKARLTSEGVARLIKNCNCNIDESTGLIKQYFGLDYLDRDQIKVIDQCKEKKIRKMLGHAISDLSLIGWTTTSHTGEDITLFTNYPVERNSEIKSLFENTEVASMIAEFSGLDLPAADELLYQEAQDAFGKLGAEVDVERDDSGTDYVVVIEKSLNGKTVRMELPVSTDICISGADKKIQNLQGITIYSPKTEKAYVSSDAVEIFRELIKAE